MSIITADHGESKLRVRIYPNAFYVMEYQQLIFVEHPTRQGYRKTHLETTYIRRTEITPHSTEYQIYRVKYRHIERPQLVRYMKECVFRGPYANMYEISKQDYNRWKLIAKLGEV